MKRVLIAVVASAALAVWGQESKKPHLVHVGATFDYDAVMQRLEQNKYGCAADGRNKLSEARQKFPELFGLNDQSALNVIHQSYYPNMEKSELAFKLCIQWPPEDTMRKLGPIDQWRYESCQSDATKAPTSHGVNAGLRICREKFGQ